MRKVFAVLFLCVSSLYAQVVYEPLYNDVYIFLSRLSQKGIIQLDDNIKPIPRIYIAEKLIQADTNRNNLAPLDREELNFYIKEYSVEINKFISNSNIESDSVNINKSRYLNNPAAKNKPTNIYRDNNKENFTLAGYDPFGRWRLFNYSDDLFKISLSPILGYETGKRDGEKNTHTWSGIRFYGYLKDYIGFSFDYRDNSESGKNVDFKKDFTKETGIVHVRKLTNNIEYSEIRTSLSANWSWGNLTIAKDFLEWGYGKSGNIVLSQKAPSFPFIRLDIKPVHWLSFNYFHAWLSSDVVDSNEIYRTNSVFAGPNRITYREKYLASHTFNVFPVKGLTISLGESIIYSDKLEIAYMMPLMFFRLADHYLSKANNSAGANSQFFFGVSSRNHLKNTHLYGTLFIDEITLSGLFDKQKQRNQLGFTLGGSMVDLPINNITLSTEYTKVYPFVYTHYIPTQTYENASYGIGHWIGNNADLFYGSINYRILRGLQTTLWGEYIRKGEDGLIDQQYMQPQPPFLFGLETDYFYSGIEVKYEIIHDLFLRGQYQYSKVSKEQIDGNYLKEKVSEFHLALYYGL